MKGKIAIVTGGGRGIGRATALAFAGEGANVVIAARTQSEIEAVADEIKKLGQEALAVPTDIQYKSQVDTMVKQAYDRFGKVDILVNNGAVAIHNPIPQIREEDWDWILDVNLKGTFLCTQAVFSQMCEQGSGHIVNVASGAGKHGGAKFGSYAVSKFGVVGLTQVTDAEGFPHGVKATVVCPGAADTKQRSQNHDDDVTKLLQPEDVADLILFVVTQPARAHIADVSIIPQFMRQPSGSHNLKPGI
ncbi:SDR family oxidoreductase [Chloroflexota bacterium]